LKAKSISKAAVIHRIWAFSAPFGQNCCEHKGPGESFFMDQEFDLFFHCVQKMVVDTIGDGNGMELRRAGR
jgi:hypothetical protein